MTIENLIASKKAQPKTDAKVDQTRFMLVLDQGTRDELRELCEALGQPQIKFASELFTLALKQARASLK